MAQRIIGLTGGIATGKTTVSDYLRLKYELTILDADVYARKAITPELVQLLADRYGQSILSSDRQLNRTELGKIIFSKPYERIWLEAQIHPYVRDQLTVEAKNYAPQTVIMAIPLLFEAKMTDLVTEIWVVNCTNAQELQRLCDRNQLTEAEAQVRIDSQLPLADKVALADVVLDNSGSLTALYKQIDNLVKLF